MKIYVDEMPKNCIECEFCGRLKPPAKQPEIECLQCNLVKKLDTVSKFCPLNSMQTLLAEKDKEIEQYKETIKEYIGTKFVKLQNQKAIEQLEQLLKKAQTLDVMVRSDHYINQKKINVVFKGTIEQQINELKGEKNDKV